MAEEFYAKSYGELLNPEQLLSMSGLDFLQGMIDGKYPAPPIAKTLNFQLISVSAGTALFHGTPEFDYCNPLGTVHGGWYGALLDSAMGCAVMSRLPQGSIYTTLEYKVNITRPIPLGTKVKALSEVSHFGRSTGVAEAKIIGVADGKLYATGSTTCIVMRP